ncbi:flagellin N-terminal helical domain-containing protein [Nocardioides mangrovi]|nr:flagellin [Nocardioides mangrovi]
MLMYRSYNGMQTAMDRVASVQEQLTTGRVINRPSDDPTGATIAMRIRSAVNDQTQYVRNANDALGWLNQIDGTLGTVTSQVTRARDLAVQANSGAAGATSREALATEIDQIRAGLISNANVTYLDRPVFGGVTAGGTAYTSDGELSDPDAIGLGTGVVRTVADGTKVRVDIEGPEVFGDDGDNLFDHLTALAAALRSGDLDAVSDNVDALDTDVKRITNVRSDIGARTNRVEQAQSVASDAQLSLNNSLSEVENVDLAKATVDLQLQEVAYQAALAATSRVVQPSLLDFLK